MPSSVPALLPTLLLASTSPRRYELLTRLGVPFTVLPAHIDEQQTVDELPQTYVVRMARTKAQTVASRQPTVFVLGASTRSLCVNRRFWGNPKGLRRPADAWVLALSGRRRVWVITALALCQHERGFMRIDSADAGMVPTSCLQQRLNTTLPRESLLTKPVPMLSRERGRRLSHQSMGVIPMW